METTTIQLDTKYLRELIEYANANDVTPRDLLDFVNSCSRYNLGLIKHSIQYNGCSLDDILKDYNVLEDDGCFYNADDYVYTDDTNIVLHRDDAYYCERTETYREEETVTVWISSRSSERWNESDAGNYAYLYDGEYYENLGNFDLIMMPDGDISHLDNVYYWERDCEYHYEPEPDDDDDCYTRDYHSGPVHEVNFTDDPQFFIGFEIEKEDLDVKESITIGDFEDECFKWKKERDGSLDDDSGYELISPKFELIPDMIKDYIMDNKVIVDHINADKSTSCGGHINLSERGKTGSELFDEVKGYTPLFYALYYKRVDKNYCKGKNNNDLKESNEKYQAIKIHSNRIEYRIVSAVPNVNTLIWRAKLIEFIVTHKTDSVKEAFFNANTSPLKNLLLEMYPDEKYNVLMERLIKFSLHFENINVNDK